VFARRIPICFLTGFLFVFVSHIKRIEFFIFLSVAPFKKLFCGVVSVEYPLMKVPKKFVKPRKKQTCLVVLGVLNKFTLFMVSRVVDS
jgi:hypothetical protein